VSEAPPLVVEHLSFRYRSRKEPALKDVSFALHPGEILLLAGASGSGKTTLARCINGLIPRSYKGELSGKVLLHEREVRGLSLVEVSQVVGTLLQDPERQILASNVLGEIAFGPENLGLPRERIRERVEEVIQRLTLEHLRQRDTFALSGGEKQKVALAGVLSMRPSILLLDEPLASLDPASAHEALAIFRKLADEGTAILMIEHRVEDALQLNPDRLMYLSNGELRYLGLVDDLPPEINHREIKLPASWVIRRVRQEKAPGAGKPVLRNGVPPETGTTPVSVSAPRTVAAPIPPPEALPQGEPLVVLENVSFAYGDGPLVLEDVNLQICQGDLIAVLGPNGAGKSTLVKHIIGLLKPKSGRVLLHGADTRKLSVAQAARSIGFIFQSPAHMLFAPTVTEELEFGPRNLGYSKDQIAQNIRESLVATNLTGLESYPPLGLSFGQQKRTSIAAVLAMRSRILIMDEPTAGQDFANYTHFMNALCQAGGAGKSLLTAHFDATLFITHDLDLAVTYANRVLLVGGQGIAADGLPQEVLCDYERLERYRVRPTSLLRLNCELLEKTGRFLNAEALAGYA
jgi:energy-coupling factor transport system ATP-binding protein